MTIRSIAVFHCQASAVPASAWSCADGITTTFAAMGYEVMDCGRPTLREVPIDALQRADLIVMSGVDWYDQTIKERYGEAWFALRAVKAAWYSESAHRDDGDFDYGRVQPLAELHYYPAAQDAEEFSGTWLPFGVDTEVFKPKPVEKTSGAAFLGTMYDKRAQYVASLNSAIEFLPLVSDDDPTRSFGLLAERYSAARIFVNLPSLSRLLVTKVTEVMACGTMLMTPAIDHPSGLANMAPFESGKHLIYYDPAKPQSVGPMIAHYLAHPEEAYGIAQAGREEVLRAHTLRQRLERVIEDAEALLAAREAPTAPPVLKLTPGVEIHALDDLGDHQTCLKGARPDTYSVILEADVELARIFPNTVTSVTLEAVRDCDVIFLECLAVQSSFEVLRGFHDVFRHGGGSVGALTVLRPFMAFCAGSAAYVVTPKGKQTLAKVFEENSQRRQPRVAVDDIYLNALYEGRLQAAIFAPFVASPRGLAKTSAGAISQLANSPARRWRALTEGFRRSLFVEADPQAVKASVAGLVKGLDEAETVDSLQRRLIEALEAMRAEPGFPERLLVG